MLLQPMLCTSELPEAEGLLCGKARGSATSCKRRVVRLLTPVQGVGGWRIGGTCSSGVK